MLERARQGAKDMAYLSAVIPSLLFLMPLMLRARFPGMDNHIELIHLDEGNFKEPKLEIRNSKKQIFLPNGTVVHAIIGGVNVLIRDFKVKDNHAGGALVQWGGVAFKDPDTQIHHMEGGKRLNLSHNGQSEYIEELDLNVMYANHRLEGNTPTY